MALINPEASKLAKKGLDITYAVLSTYDGSEKYSFMVNPIETEREFRMSLSKLPVRNTANPLLSYNYSEGSISLSDIKFWSPGNDLDLTPVLTQLARWTVPDKDQAVPKLLKFLWGTQTVNRCYLERFRYRVTQTRGGNPVEATGSIELAIAPEAPELKKIGTGGSILTIREQSELADQIKTKVSKDKKLQEKYGITSKDTFTVSSDGLVSVTQGKQKPRTIGKIGEVLGADLKNSLKTGQ